ncbi:YgeY family selenium metabolism-linked hydrolase [Pseudoflavonifractor sp. MSJ-37]|uniref:YgeY family selenium metabolism-linked hydrolase n=1 Tax=Pseudoflavonifractor sp. MSJ-37 TaxID=2841531 RepID=UPI001C0F4F72|nr:YgeY family selenium metabolism-linked hydrolase [Pseudoflavonifractor sp. MSJ-37]MBU5434227.1 YgeY family selenium metabolism-linked hydrolase [Pseudoflavonifractor sp. MSJ-37]
MITKKEALAQIKEYVKAQEDEVVQFLKDFIAIESVTYNEGNAIQFLAGKMKEFGFDEVRVDPVGNVVGRVGSGKTVLMYDSHIDTVELGDPADWGMDPLKAQMEEGKVLRGRGAVDDKGCLTGITFAGKALKALGLDKDFTLWVSGSISEEDVEGSCVKAMLEENPDIKPDFVLVAESSNNRVIRGHKGRALIKIDVPGKCAHASTAWRGDNALVKALPIMEKVDKFQDFVEDPFLGKGSIEVTMVECKAPSLNTIPGEAIITCDRRISCGESIEDLLKETAQFYEGIEGVTASIDTEKVKTYTGYDITCVDYFPSWVMPEDHPLIKAGVEAFTELFDKAPVVDKWEFCTNATHMCGRLGIPAIGYGPGDDSLCHSTQDKVPVDELMDAICFYASLPIMVPKKD